MSFFSALKTSFETVRVVLVHLDAETLLERVAAALEPRHEAFDRREAADDADERADERPRPERDDDVHEFPLRRIRRQRRRLRERTRDPQEHGYDVVEANREHDHEAGNDEEDGHEIHDEVQRDLVPPRPPVRLSLFPVRFAAVFDLLPLEHELVDRDVERVLLAREDAELLARLDLVRARANRFEHLSEETVRDPPRDRFEPEDDPPDDAEVRDEADERPD
eukprot:20427-Pelagococcus_subviridis.AAC.2